MLVTLGSSKGYFLLTSLHQNATAEKVINYFEIKIVSNERVTKSFERVDVSNERVTKPFERADVSSERVTKTFEHLTNGL